MKKSFRRALAMLLASLMLVSALPAYAVGEPLSSSPELFSWMTEFFGEKLRMSQCMQLLLITIKV